MTPRVPSVEEWARVVAGVGDGRFFLEGWHKDVGAAIHARVAQLITEAVAAEREACALLCESMYDDAGWAFADAIRARERRAETAP